MTDHPVRPRSASARGPSVYRRPRAGTRTARVWQIADEITRETGRLAKRREVRERFVAEQGNAGTANTQYQYWRADQAAPPADRTAAATAPLANISPRTLKVTPDGRLQVPRDLCEAMQLDADGLVTVRVDAGELRVVSRTVAIRQTQARMRPYRKPGESVVDEFLAERRALWGGE